MLEIVEVLKSCGVLAHANGSEKQPPLRLDVEDTRRIRAAMENVPGTASARRRAIALMSGMLCANEAYANKANESN